MYWSFGMLCWSFMGFIIIGLVITTILYIFIKKGDITPLAGM
jgi:hypothetical protein